jgi:hypothetical protein
MGLDDRRMRLVQRHVRRVAHQRPRGRPCDHRLGHEAPRIKADRAGGDEPLRLERQELRIPRPRPDEVDRHAITFFA